MLEQSQNSAPQLPNAVSGLDYFSKADNNDRIAYASAKADSQNQMLINKYNNDYNYWLWQQQTAYNSPVEQRRRLEEAGLNPNFNSIEGAGNASSPAPSQAKSGSNFLGAYQASISAKSQKLNEINSIVNSFNDLVKNIGQGFDMYKTYVTTPGNSTLYGNDLATLMHSKASSASFDASIKNLMYKIASGQATDDEMDTPFGKHLLGLYGADAWKAQIAQQTYKNLVKDGDLKDIVKDLKLFERDELQPKQRDILEKQIDSLFSRTQFIDTQNEMYKRLKVSGMLLPFALMLFKGLM